MSKETLWLVSGKAVHFFGTRPGGSRPLVPFSKIEVAASAAAAVEKVSKEMRAALEGFMGGMARSSEREVRLLFPPPRPEEVDTWEAKEVVIKGYKITITKEE